MTLCWGLPVEAQRLRWTEINVKPTGTKLKNHEAVIVGDKVYFWDWVLGHCRCVFDLERLSLEYFSIRIKPVTSHVSYLVEDKNYSFSRTLPKESLFRAD